MSLSGTRGLIRISKNPACELQAAMVADGVREPEFYRRLTGRRFEGEFGERVAARRRGAKFEAHLHQNNAALLRNALGPAYGLSPDSMVVRNFADEVPGTRDGVRAQRLYRMRLIFKDLAAGKPVPHLLIQPQLCLPIGPGPRDVEFVSPDFMVLDPGIGMYRPGEEKSFIVRGNVADKADLDGTRRQAAVQVLALKAEAARVGLDGRVNNRAVFVFATAFGLSPARPFEEALDAEMREIRRAAQVLLETRARLNGMRAGAETGLQMLADELDVHYQEGCVGTCILADVCRERHVDTVRAIGDEASDLLGPDLELRRLVALMKGDAPRTPDEQIMAVRLAEAVKMLPGLVAELQKTA